MDAEDGLPRRRVATKNGIIYGGERPRRADENDIVELTDDEVKAFGDLTEEAPEEGDPSVAVVHGGHSNPDSEFDLGPTGEDDVQVEGAPVVEGATDFAAPPGEESRASKVMPSPDTDVVEVVPEGSVTTAPPDEAGVAIDRETGSAEVVEAEEKPEPKRGKK